ncbi:hypothetical protein K3977_02920 [Weissella viridescens]|uniref:hypothetical protein n=1 Tax=Weissella viridescens TaxID=1629 RepID=UPI001C7D5A6E|nr:hypothetical protein [Weissella viridescens]MBX4172575.1 hypothetical protein [Weissella viridescens]
MTKTAVHVTSLEQWKSVLDIWFKQGYEWHLGAQEYNESAFEQGGRFLYLDDDITYNITNYRYEPFIEYSEFMAQQKEDKKMAKVYEFSQSVFNELQRIKAHEGTSLIGAIASNAQFIESIVVGNKAILRYLADDPAIEFKVKEPLYRLGRIDDVGDVVYMGFSFGSPTWVVPEADAFTAPLEEIKKWQTPAWEIEQVEE